MSLFTYKSLYQYVEEVIDKRSTFSTTASYENQLTRDSISPVLNRQDLTPITSTQNILADALLNRILTGLTVLATSPISNKVIVEAGSGTVDGWVYTLNAPITLTIPLDSNTVVFYIVLYKDSIGIEASFSPLKLTIAKIVVPSPGITAYIQDDKDDSLNAYIVNFFEYRLYGNSYGKFEEDTIELLRNNISPILSDNLIGNIRLTEDLKIINTSGTLELNSNSLKFYDSDTNKLSEFNTEGIYFYDIGSNILAKFTKEGAQIGNIALLPESIQSTNYVPNSAGFVIYSDGDAEFNSIRLRGTLYTVYISENVYIQPGVTFIGQMNFNDDIALLADHKLIFDRDMSSDTYWVYNSSTQYLEGWVDGIKRIEL